MQLHGSQRLTGGLVALWMFSVGSPVSLAGDGRVDSVNYHVVADSSRLAQDVASCAESMRRQVALDWLGTELPAVERRTDIYVEENPQRSYARVLIDSARNRIWISGSREQITGSLLRHEVAHTVLASRFGSSMPVWANEGIASRYDNAVRKAVRRRKLESFSELDSWPSLQQLMTSPVRSQWAYAASVSVTDFLVARGGRAKFLDFVELADEQGWNQALTSKYGIRSVAQLQTEWQDSVRQRVRY